jgi:hypothetical protein
MDEEGVVDEQVVIVPELRTERGQEKLCPEVLLHDDRGARLDVDASPVAGGRLKGGVGQVAGLKLERFPARRSSAIRPW